MRDWRSVTRYYRALSCSSCTRGRVSFSAPLKQRADRSSNYCSTLPFYASLQVKLVTSSQVCLLCCNPNICCDSFIRYVISLPCVYLMPNVSYVIVGVSVVSDHCGWSPSSGYTHCEYYLAIVCVCSYEECTPTHMCMCTPTHMCICTPTHMRMCTPTHVCMCTPTHVYVYTHTHVYVYTHTHVHVYTQIHMNVQTQIYTHTCAHARTTHAYMHASTDACTQACMHTCTDTHACIHTCTDMHARTHSDIFCYFYFENPK